MTYLDWGCEPLREECQSCLDTICRACVDEFKRQAGRTRADRDCHDSGDEVVEPDCGRCSLDKKPGCATCEVVFSICRSCKERETCDIRIC